MASEDSPGGLFSKVVSFVRHPATPWTELDKASNDSQNLSKQQLKAIVERKRHNELLRKREFGILRKLRRHDPQTEQEVAGHPSFFNSSLPTPAPAKPQQHTLKQIADIEADMAKKWWQSKLGDVVTDTSAPDAPVAPPWPRLVPDSERPRDNTNFSTSKSLAVDVAEVGRDVALEDAAMHFANGEDAAAEATLLGAIAPHNDRHDHADTWLALFDFYRATGQAGRFDTLAVEFAQQFSRSAPPWFSMLAQVQAIAPATPVLPAARASDWNCPDVLSRFAVMTLSAAKPRVAGQWRLDWSQLKEIDLSAVEPLLTLLRNWRGQTVQIEFAHPDKLVRVLQQATPSAEPAVDAVWWQLRMEACRVMGQVEAFDQVALDYCVTYEVSPPSWEPVRCTYTPVDAQGFPVIDFSVVSSNVVDTALLGPSAYRQSEWHTVGMGLPPLPGGAVVNTSLSGQLTGDAPLALAQLAALSADAGTVRIACNHLVRLDFAAAGALLNWVSAQHAEQRSVVFSEVHRLLAPFFGVIGITACASVVVRTD